MVQATGLGCVFLLDFGYTYVQLYSTYITFSVRFGFFFAIACASVFYSVFFMFNFIFSLRSTFFVLLISFIWIGLLEYYIHILLSLLLSYLVFSSTFFSFRFSLNFTFEECVVLTYVYVVNFLFSSLLSNCLYTHITWLGFVLFSAMPICIHCDFRIRIENSYDVWSPSSYLRFVGTFSSFILAFFRSFVYFWLKSVGGCRCMHVCESHVDKSIYD